MYEQYFGFRERPFSIAPDPRFLYLSERHRDALAHLVYGLNDQGGFVMLTGEVGTGKTTLCRSLLEQVPPHIDVAFVLNPRLDAVELLETIADELRIDRRDANGSIKRLVDHINEQLLRGNAAGRSTVLLIDEAQNLSADVLEQLRLLTNLETNERKLLRIILIGQPELAQMLARPDLRQLAQRITARYHLGPLKAADTAAYVQHRLALARGSADRREAATDQLFTPAAVRTLHRLSAGIPRIINVIADRALLGAYATTVRRINATLVRRAARESRGAPTWRQSWLPAWRFPWRALTVSAALLAVAVIAWYAYRWPSQAAPSSSTTATLPSAATNSVAVGRSNKPTALPPAQPTISAHATQVAVALPAHAQQAAATPTSTVVRPDSTVGSTNLLDKTLRSQANASKSEKLSATVNDIVNDTVSDTVKPVPQAGVATEGSAPEVIRPSTGPAHDVIDEKASAPDDTATPQPAAGGPLNWPADAPRSRSLDLAFAAVFDRWHAPYTRRSSENACTYAKRVGLACMFGEGDWKALLAMNRPAILKLSDGTNGDYFVALLAVKGKLAEVLIGNKTQWLSAAQIDDAWHGQYTVLWQTPPGYREPLEEGASGATVRALREKLQSATGTRLAVSGTFDSELANALKSYQIARGLDADGRAGPRTWIALHDATRQPAPHLRTE